MLIATSGHVDHGKTRLVQALTGVDTDRLPEEKARGLTIDLGFAYVTDEHGARLGFVDVPGHERFIRNMIAGVPAIDFALLVVAADDGPMPQTLEHLAILDLLGVSGGVVAVTKIDRVDTERVREVTRQIEALLPGTCLEGARILPVSAETSHGVPALAEALWARARSLRERPAEGLFRLAIDRVFSPQGAGLVVTGAVYDGELELGDRLTLVPAGKALRVRGIEHGGAAVTRTRAGERAAINLTGRGVGAADVERGDWLVGDDAPRTSERFDARLRLLASESRELKHWTAVHVHHGAGFFTARVSPLAGAPIVPGGEGLVQIVLDRPTHLVHGDRVLLRDASGRRTIGGARVLDPFAPRRVRDRERRLRLLEVSAREGPQAALAHALDEAPEGVEAITFARARNFPLERVATLIAQADAVVLATRRGERLVSAERAAAMDRRLLESLAGLHAEQPERVGPSREELLHAGAAGESTALVEARIEALIRSARIVRDGAGLRLPEHAPTLSKRDADRLERLRSVLTPRTLKAPSVSDLANSLDLPREVMLDFLKACERRGQLVRVADNRYFDPQALVGLAHVAETLAGSKTDGRFTAKEFRDASAIGRNLTIDVLEYFDRRGFTRRLGDLRVVVKTPDTLFT